jgi:hypothetical protein
MPKKGSPMSPAVVQNAVLPEKHKTEITAVGADILVNPAKCSLLFVLLVERKPPYPSNLPVINLCIAVIATNLAHVTIGKLLIAETFPGLNAWEGFFFRFTMKSTHLLELLEKSE